MAFRSSTIDANLTKGSASTGDVLRLLRMWDPDEESGDAFQKRAIEENLLGKPSRRRARDLVNRVLSVRYLPNGTDAPARHIQHLAKAGVSREVIDGILYYHAALAEHLLYLTAAEVVYEMRARDLHSISGRDVRYFLSRLERCGRVAGEYSDSVREKLAQSTLTALRDFGILEGRAKKRIAPVRIPHPVVGYVVYALKDEGNSAKRIVEHSDWRLFLLSLREAEERITDVGGYGYYNYRSAGDIRRFDWKYGSLKEYVDQLA